MDNYGKYEDGASPPCSAQYSARSATCPPSRDKTNLVFPSPPVGGQPVGQAQIVYAQSPVIPEHESPDHFVLAILATIFCCFPLGLIGILKSNECRSARERGDRDAAYQHSRSAKKFSLIAVGCGIAVYVLIVAIYAVLLLMMMMIGTGSSVTIRTD